MGAVDMAVMESTPGMSIEILVRHYVFFIECIWTIAAPGVEDQMITIEDVAGVGPRMLTPRILKFIRAVTTIVKVRHAIITMTLAHSACCCRTLVLVPATELVLTIDCIVLEICVLVACRTTTWSAATVHSSSMLPMHSLWCGRCVCITIILLIVISIALAVTLKYSYSATACINY
jgi:hypothetical protein